MLFGLPPIHADYVDYTARVAIVEGYNTNTYQAQDDPTKPIIVRHPSLFTGVDTMLQAKNTRTNLDIDDFRIQGRFQHYEPLTPQYQSDDGSFNAGWTSRITLSPRTILSLGATGTVTSINSSHINDGTLFLFDPTQVRRTYWLVRSDPAITYALAPTWRVSQRIGVITSGTIDGAGAAFAGSGGVPTPIHRGLDYVEVDSDTMLMHDFTPRTMGDLRLLVQSTDSVYLLDLTSSPPGQNIGPQLFETGTLTAAVTYTFTPRLTNRLAVGGTLASPPPLQPDNRLQLSPAFLDQLYYTREFWYFAATAAYQYGTVNPTIGAGPGGSIAATLVGTPYRRGHWRNLAVMGNLGAGHSSILSGTTATTAFDTVAATLQIRYGFTTWLGLLAGYDFRYASIQTTVPPPAVSPYLPPLLRQVFFVGLSGYFSTDPNTPALTTFQPPINPG